MKGNYKPTMYAKDIFSINYQKLKENNIKCLIFDIDNTIAATNIKHPQAEVIKLFENLKKENFTIIILSNALPKRVLNFGKILNAKTYFFACKPLSFNYLRIMKKYSLSSANIAAIGDQIYTDIKGANKLKITSILVDQISNKEFITTKLNRLKENHLISKTKIINRGEYYE